MTQAFHLVPDKRSKNVPQRHIDESFDTVTRHELAGRKVIALGDDAAAACARHGVPHRRACHPSRRGSGCTNQRNGESLAAALADAGFNARR